MTFFPGIDEPNTFLDEVQSARSRGSSNRSDDIIDPNTGMTLADYIDAMRGAGEVPAFTNMPGRGPDEFFYDPAPAAPSKGVIPLPELDPKLTNLAAATTSAEALSNKRDLDLSIANTMKQLEYDKMEELGLNNLRKRIETLQSIPGAEEYANPLINKYNAGLEQVNRELNSPEMSARWKELGTLSLKWGDKAAELEKAEAHDMSIMRSLGTTTEEGMDLTGSTGRKKTADLELSRAQAEKEIGPLLPNVMLLLNDTKEGVLDRYNSDEVLVQDAKILATYEHLKKEEADITTMEGKFSPKKTNNMYTLILDRAQNSGDLSEEARSSIENALKTADENVDSEYATLVTQIKTLRAKEQKTLASKIDIDKEEKKQLYTRARTMAYDKEFTKLKDKLIAEQFSAAMDISTLTNIDPEIKRVAQELKNNNQLLFAYPENTADPEIVANYFTKWRAAAADVEASPDIIKATIATMAEKAVRQINAENSSALPGHKTIISGKHPILDGIAYNIILGKTDDFRTGGYRPPVVDLLPAMISVNSILPDLLLRTGARLMGKEQTPIVTEAMAREYGATDEQIAKMDFSKEQNYQQAMQDLYAFMSRGNK